ncbi:4Fe-4S binding protein [Bacillus sp. FJAT-27251]|uniref:4Fe-4S dicluster domain-containing protein n=1 Tax=Bacillus sp. FJAT-27251 TaxID=1684142 RepID=UPI0006A77765|nr:4Fe-4S binding protein [Bacillus sp. FJAT-27251]
MSENLNRRQFLKENWEVSIGFLGSFLTQAEEKPSFFRPPGASGEFAFLSSCTRCGRCKEACEEGAISLFTAGAGAQLAFTPFLDPNLTPCTMCGKCAEACGAGVLNPTGRLQIGKARIIPDFCLAFQKISCDYCLRACPEKALTLNNGSPEVNCRCTGCGLCTASCISDYKGIWVDLPS